MSDIRLNMDNVSASNGSLCYRYDPYSPKAFLYLSSRSSEAGASGTSSRGSVSPVDSPTLSPAPPGSNSPNDAPLGASTPAVDFSALLTTLRGESTDAGAGQAIMALSAATALGLVRHLTRNAPLMKAICLNERGNVLAHLMTKVGSNTCQPFVDLCVRNLVEFATNRSGCLAITRMFENASCAQRMAISEAAIQHFEDLAPHQYGNYVIQRVVEESQTVAAIDDKIAALLSQGNAIQYLTGSKFGSHVVEKFFKVTSVDHAIAVFDRCILEDPPTLRHLVHHNFGNYVLQTALRRIGAAMDVATPFRKKVSARVVPVLAGSSHAQNIGKALQC